ncbi:hypothetical protein SAURM35S_07400 [Streptomyces aurantiogriseus]
MVSAGASVPVASCFVVSATSEIPNRTTAQKASTPVGWVRRKS